MSVVLQRLIDDAGGPSKLARRIKESPQTVNNWKARGVSVRGARKLARFFKVKRAKLRADIFGG